MNCPRCQQTLKSTNILFGSLSPKQFQLARRFALGQTRAEIAEVFGMSRHNVVQTLLTVMTKLGVRNSVELALLVHGLLDQAQQTIEELATR